MVMALYGLKDSMQMSWQLATGKLPAKDAEQYVATMMATTILTVAVGRKLQKMARDGSENDAQFWELTPELRNQYNTGRQMVPSRVWQKFERWNMAGDAVDDAIRRGALLERALSRGQRMLLAGEGLAQALKNQATLPPSRRTGISLGEWLGTGLTPDFRWVFMQQGHVVAASVVTTMGTIENYITAD